MYNLLVTGHADRWNEEPFDYDKDRVFQYSSSTISKTYDIFKKEDADELISYPCLFAYEQSLDGQARIGWITQVKTRGKEIRIYYKLDPSLPPIDSSEIKKLEWDLGIDDWEMNRTHWSIKDVDLTAVLIEAGIFQNHQASNSPVFKMAHVKPLTELKINPAVFKIPHDQQEMDLVSVMMPFSPPFDEVFVSLKDACNTLSLKCQRADDIWVASEVMQDVFSLIYRSRFVICDFSTRNTNVFYEAGIAHTLGRVVIPIVQHESDVPFDLRHHRFIIYLNNSEGRLELQEAITKRLMNLTRQ